MVSVSVPGDGHFVSVLLEPVLFANFKTNEQINLS